MPFTACVSSLCLPLRRTASDAGVFCLWLLFLQTNARYGVITDGPRGCKIQTVPLWCRPSIAHMPFVRPARLANAVLDYHPLGSKAPFVLLLAHRTHFHPRAVLSDVFASLCTCVSFISQSFLRWHRRQESGGVHESRRAHATQLQNVGKRPKYQISNIKFPSSAQRRAGRKPCGGLLVIQSHSACASPCRSSCPLLFSRAAQSRARGLAL